MKHGGRIFLSLRLFFVLLVPVSVFSQATVSDSAIRAAGVNTAVGQFRDFMGTAAPLYSGPRYTEYYAQMKESHPFFMGTVAHPGEVMFDHILYPNIFLKYDMLMNKVVLSDSVRLLSTSLNIDKIDYFTIAGQRFIKLYKTKTNNLPETNFYQVLYAGKNLTLYKKDQRKINEDTDHKRYIWSDVSYYLEKDGRYYSISGQSSALNAMDDKRQQLRNYIRSNDLSFRENLEAAVQGTVKYYDSLLK